MMRDTDWRQGDLLTQEAAAKLPALSGVFNDERRVVVITHDCDLHNSSEAVIEVIVADIVDKANPQFSYAKNPRKLHLSYDISGGQSSFIELSHGERRRAVPKSEFDEFAAKDSSASLALDAKRVLKQWLAARYGRPAFPNAFEARLRKQVDKKSTVERQIGKILEPDAKHLVGLFFDLGEQRLTEAAAEEPYWLRISVVYDMTEGCSHARHSAENVARQLTELFQRVYGTPEIATEIALEACEPVADTVISLADLRRVDQWRLEYISLGDDQCGEFLEVGRTPA
jgi:hypothetical protein